MCCDVARRASVAPIICGTCDTFTRRLIRLISLEGTCCAHILTLFLCLTNRIIASICFVCSHNLTVAFAQFDCLTIMKIAAIVLSLLGVAAVATLHFKEEVSRLSFLVNEHHCFAFLFVQ